METAKRTNPLAARRYQGRVLVAAHRGTSGGNIVQNTIAAYQNALCHGADIVEIDIERSKDGVFYAFHSGQEMVALGLPVSLQEIESARLDTMQMRNSLGHPVNQTPCRMQAVLQALKGKPCLINLDRTWWYWDELLPQLATLGMEDQLLLKSPAEDALLEKLARLAPGLAYMPICYTLADVRRVQRYDVNLVACELIFTTLEDELAQPEAIRALRDEGLALWANAITLDDEIILTAGLDDNASILNSPAAGWGRLVEMGFDILQTDWPMLLKHYLTGMEK